MSDRKPSPDNPFGAASEPKRGASAREPGRDVSAHGPGRDASAPQGEAPTLEERRATLRRLQDAHWRRTRRLTSTLLLVWLATGFVSVFFARELDNLSVFGWPLSFYMAAQGAALIYLAILGVYAWRMARLDRQFRQRRGPDEETAA